MLKEILVPDQNANNLVKVYGTDSGCCAESSNTVCKYEATVATSATVTALVMKDVDGSAVTKTFTGVVGGANVVPALRAALNDESYEDDGKLPVDVSYRISGSNTIYTIVGEAEVTSLTRTGGSSSFTATCNEIGMCTFYAEWAGGNAKVFQVNETENTLADLTFSTASAADVDTALTAVLPANSSAVVVKNDDDDVFEITITSPANNQFTIDGTAFTRSDCVTDYV